MWKNIDNQNQILLLQNLALFQNEEKYIYYCDFLQ